MGLRLAGALLLCSAVSCGGKAKTVERLTQGLYDSCASSLDCTSGSCLCGVCSTNCQVDTECAQEPSSVCANPGTSLHDVYCAGRLAPALCLPDSDPDSLLGPYLDAPDGGVSEPPRSGFCSRSTTVWRSLELRSQEEFDAMQGCEVVQGSLTIVPVDGIDPTGLNTLREVAGTLVVRGPQPNGGTESTDPLAGLDALASVGELALTRLDMTSLRGLEGLREIGGGLSIRACSSLSDLSGLQGLRSAGFLDLEQVGSLAELRGVGGDVRFEHLNIQHASRLKNLEGIAPQGVVSVRLTNTGIVNLSSLRDFAAMRQLRLGLNRELVSVDGLAANSELEYVSLDANPQLSSLVGMAEGLKVERLEIANDNSLTNLRGLENLAELAKLRISDAYSLESLVGLPGNGGLRELVVEQCPRLTELGDIGWAPNVESVQLKRLALLSRLPLGTTQIQSLEFCELPALVDLSEIEGVVGLESLYLHENPGLVSFDGLPSVDSLANLSLMGNAQVLALPDKLSGVSELGSLSIARTALQSVSFPNVTKLEEVVIIENKALTSIGLGALQSVEYGVTFYGNPGVPLEERQALASTISDERAFIDGTLPLANCPWSGDGVCDETSGLCTAGSDLVDCGVTP